MRKYLLTLLWPLLLFAVTPGHAQVTIGSDLEPRKGALLDIKEENNTGHQPNADRGLGLPRVQLVDPAILTVATDDKKAEHVGITVYNVGNTHIPEGIYSWDGTRWKLHVGVNDFGTSGQLIQSEGDGTFSWSTFVVPEYKYHKPTQIAVFDENKATNPTNFYSYSDITGGGSGTYYKGVKPRSTTFDNRFDYTESLKIQTAESNEKYLLLGIAGVINMTTIKNGTPVRGFWQIVQFDVYIDDEPVQSNKRLYGTPAQGDNSIYVDLFSIIHLTHLAEDTYDLKIRISNVENSFPNNADSNNTNQGFFYPGTTKFYEVTLTDVNFVLYEAD